MEDIGGAAPPGRKAAGGGKGGEGEGAQGGPAPEMLSRVHRASLAKQVIPLCVFFSFFRFYTFSQLTAGAPN